MAVRRSTGVAILVLLGALCVPSARGQSEVVIYKEGTTQYHRPACPVVRDGRGVLLMSRAQAESRRLTSHPDCDPANTPTAKSPEPKVAKPAPPVFVYLDTGKYYHRENCRKLGKEKKKAPLDEAGKNRWPCPTCRPPIRSRDPVLKRHG